MKKWVIEKIPTSKNIPLTSKHKRKHPTDEDYNKKPTQTDPQSRQLKNPPTHIWILFGSYMGWSRGVCAGSLLTSLLKNN